MRIIRCMVRLMDWRWIIMWSMEIFIIKIVIILGLRNLQKIKLEFLKLWMIILDIVIIVIIKKQIKFLVIFKKLQMKLLKMERSVIWLICIKIIKISRRRLSRKHLRWMIQKKIMRFKLRNMRLERHLNMTMSWQKQSMKIHSWSMIILVENWRFWESSLWFTMLNCLKKKNWMI